VFLTLVSAPWGFAADVNTNLLGINGWFSDDTRADGTGTQVEGLNLVSDLLTDDPEATAVGTSAHDADILGQTVVGDGAPPVAPPAGEWTFGAHMVIAGGSNLGKSQISHRKDDGTGHASGDAIGPAFTADYSWMGDGTASVTASFKIGFKTLEFVSTTPSSRTGENAWDKLLVYEPGNGNGGTSNSTWFTGNSTWTTGNWWLVDRTNGANSMANDMTLEAMSTSTLMVGGRELQAIFALIADPGAQVTTVQFGVGSYNQGASVWVNQLETNFYRPGDRTTFGGPVPVELMRYTVE
jgi:hypothetical protein